MTPVVATDPIPLYCDTYGVLRVGGTQVTLDTVITAFHAGASAEEISDDYPLNLADVYAVIAYYLRHRAEIDSYLARRRQEAEAARQEDRTRYGHSDLRQRLLDRLASQGQS